MSDTVLHEAGRYTREEIFSQPVAWRGVLDVLDANAADVRALLTAGAFEQVVFTGCGSTYYLCLLYTSPAAAGRSTAAAAPVGAGRNSLR